MTEFDSLDNEGLDFDCLLINNKLTIWILTVESD